MKRVLIIGCGNIAKRIIPLLIHRYRVFALVRDATRCEGLRAMGAIPLPGDLDHRASLTRIAGFGDIVLHFAPPPSTGARDMRTRNLIGALSRGALPSRMVYISTSSVYGDCGGAWVSETRPVNSQTMRAQRRSDAEMQIRGWAKRNSVKACILRVPGIYAADRLPLKRLQQGIPCIVDSEDSYTSHIHADDLVRIVVATLREGSACRVYHASDDSQMKMGEYFDRVAIAFGLPHVPRISRDEAQRVLPEPLLSFMNESRRLTNRRMKEELGVKLRYPTVDDLLAEVQQRFSFPR